MKQTTTTRWYGALAMGMALLAPACGDDDPAPSGPGAGGGIDAGGGAGGSSSQPTQPLLDEYVLSSDDSVPEGVTFDPVERAFYVGSLAGRGLTKIEADGSESSFGPSDIGTTVGLKVDAANRRLWACGGNRLLALALEDGELLATFPLDAASPGAGCNDVTVDSSGRAYATDSNQPNIYSVAIEDAAATIFATDPLFEATFLGLNGIEVTEDGEVLFAVMFAAGRLLRISMSDPSEVSEVELSGGAFGGPDGLVVLDGAVYAVSNSDVKKVTFADGDLRAGTVTSAPYPEGGLSTGTAAEGSLYAVKSETVAFITGGDLNLPFKIVRFAPEAFE
jgi:sugar lactone lactonase YvrE